MSGSQLQVAVKGAVMEVAMARPPVNAINLALSREMYDAFRRLNEDDSLRVGLLYSAGNDRNIFSAGWDLKAFAAGESVDAEHGFDLGPGGLGGLPEFFDLYKPVVVALAGGAIGGVLDRQAGELRQSLGPDVGVVNTGNEIVVTMPQDILFATDSAALRPDLQSDLRTIAANLQRYPDSVVVVTGHTDSTGTAAHNQALSERRADAVAGVLISSGVPARRIQAVGAGQTQPIASNGSASGRAQNRRVEITIRPTN